MQAELLRELLNEVRAGHSTVESAIERLRNLPYEDLGYARLDHHRALRKGFPEVVFCEGKRTEHVVEIMQRLEHKHSPVLATRASREVYEAVLSAIPHAKYFDDARIIQLGVNGTKPTTTTVLIVCAGTADVAARSVRRPASGAAPYRGNEGRGDRHLQALSVARKRLGAPCPRESDAA